MAKISDEQIFQRQINYFIIRRLWYTIKHCVESEEVKNDLYETLGIKRNAYTRLVTGSTYSTPRISKARQKILEKTGLSREIFNGDEIIELKNISKDDWKNYFKNRYPEKDEEVDSSKQKEVLKEMNDKLLKEFADIETHYSYNSDIFVLYCFIKYGKKLTNDRNKLYVNNCINSLDSISFSYFSLLDDTELINIRTILEKKLFIVNTIINYNKIKI